MTLFLLSGDVYPPCQPRPASSRCVPFSSPSPRRESGSLVRDPYASRRVFAHHTTTHLTHVTTRPTQTAQPDQPTQSCTRTRHARSVRVTGQSPTNPIRSNRRRRRQSPPPMSVPVARRLLMISTTRATPPASSSPLLPRPRTIYTFPSRAFPPIASAPLPSSSRRCQRRSRCAASSSEMTVTSSVKVAGGELSVHGRTVLSGVPEAVRASSAAAAGPVDGVFLGGDFAEPASRHVVSLGAMRFSISSIRCLCLQI